MNKSIIFIASLLIISLSVVRGQSPTPVVCEPLSAPVLLLKGNVTTIGSDSAWLVSPYRLRLYEESRSLILSLNTANVESLIGQYEHKLKLYSYWNDSLRQSYRLLSHRYDSTILRTSSELSRVGVKLDQANASILESKARLDEAIESVKKSRTEKWLWGLGGILAGLGIASLL